MSLVRGEVSPLKVMLIVPGGHHSIGSNITWTLIELQKRPDVLTKLMTEIESVEAVDFTTVTTRMPYLDAVIMEINRLYPSVPATLRVIERETRLQTSKKPVTLKPGMLIYLSYLHMHTSPKYWGSSAGEFNPDRFLNGVDKSKPFMAFGSGTRDCVSTAYERQNRPKLISLGWIQICAAVSEGVPHHAVADL